MGLKRDDDQILGVFSSQVESLGGLEDTLVVRFLLAFPVGKIPQRTTSTMFGGPIYAAIGNRQQRSDH
jgi:hypothetical protein